MGSRSKLSPPEAVTPEPLYRRRREWIKDALSFSGTALAVGAGLVALTDRRVDAGFLRRPGADTGTPPPASGNPGPVPAGAFDTTEAQTPYKDITAYNNFYEFGTSKSDPARNAGTLRPHPWTVHIGGLVKRPQQVDMETLSKWAPQEERIYRMRCVEAWSMVIPWMGLPLGALLRRVEPLGKAKYVAFTTLHDVEQMPGQLRPVLDWPYVEGLRLDEAMHPLTILATGLYGKPLPAQNGAPLRLVVPWKYGFKGIKSIVKIELTENEPPTTWNQSAPHEYGFYANVNPEVDHPRWSQGTERRIGELRRIKTLMFNGYGEQVAQLYRGMDLRKWF